MSDSLPLGKIIDSEQQRDAIHIAVAPVLAACSLSPGQHIGFVEGSTELVEGIADGPRASQNKPAIGIVDPFLTVRVMKGDRFWMFLYPQTITSLRHDWTHPAFEPVTPVAAVPDKSASEEWLKAYAEKFPGWSLERMLESAENKLSGGYGLNSQTDIPNGAFDELTEFWRHYEIVTEQKVDDGTRTELPFYCGC